MALPYLTGHTQLTQFQPYTAERNDTEESVLPHKFRHFCRTEPNIFKEPIDPIMPVQEPLFVEAKQETKKSYFEMFSLSISSALAWLYPNENVKVSFEGDKPKKAINEKIGAESETLSCRLLKTESTEGLELGDINVNPANHETRNFEETLQEESHLDELVENLSRLKALLEIASAEEKLPLPENLQDAVSTLCEPKKWRPSLETIKEENEEPSDPLYIPKTTCSDEWGSSLTLTRSNSRSSQCEEVGLFESSPDSESDGSHMLMDFGLLSLISGLEEYDSESEEEEEEEEELEDTEEQQLDVPDYLQNIYNHQAVGMPHMGTFLLLDALANNLKVPEFYQKSSDKVHFSMLANEEFEPGMPLVRNCKAIARKLRGCLKKKKPKKRIISGSRNRPLSNKPMLEDFQLEAFEEDIQHLLDHVDFSKKGMDELDYDIEIGDVVQLLTDVFQKATTFVNKPNTQKYIDVCSCYHQLRVQIEQASKRVNALITRLEVAVFEESALEANIMPHVVQIHEIQQEIHKKIIQLKNGQLAEKFVAQHAHAVELQQQLETIFLTFFRCHQEGLQIGDIEDASYLVCKKQYDDTCLLLNLMKPEETKYFFESYIDQLQNASDYFLYLLFLFVRGVESHCARYN